MCLILGKLTVAVLFLACNLNGTVAASHQQESKMFADLAGINYPSPRQLDFVTVVNGKAYFSKDISKTWKEAAEYCNSFGMALATIESHAEWDDLSKELSPFKGGGVWTDARESRKPQMYVWNNTDVQLSSSVVRGWDDRYVRNHDYSYCIVFYSYPSADYPTGMYPVPCRNKQKILRQLRISN